MKIRNATDADLPAIVAIYNASIPGRMATADTEPVSVNSRRTWFAEHVPGRWPLWVAEEEDRVAGWLSLQMFYGRPAYHATAEVSVYVAPSHQRQGVGCTLLRHAVDSAPVLQLQTFVGFIFGHNEPSLRLFESEGFQRWGRLPGIANLDGIARDVVIMGWHVAQ